MHKQLKVTYIRSAIGRSFKQKRVVRALGFKRLKQSRIVEATPSMLGMIRKIPHLLEVVPVASSVDSTEPVSLSESDEAGPPAEPTGGSQNVETAVEKEVRDGNTGTEVERNG